MPAKGQQGDTSPKPISGARLPVACECGDHVFALTTLGQVTLVDPEDAHFLQRGWCAVRKGRTWYASRSTKKRKFLLHREIMQAPDDMDVDHRFGWGMDNRKRRMRLLTRGLNNRNKQAPTKAKSGFLGVTLHPQYGLFMAFYRHEKKNRVAGYYRTALEAAKARDAIVHKLYPGIARLNFPEDHHDRT